MHQQSKNVYTCKYLVASWLYIIGYPDLLMRWTLLVMYLTGSAHCWKPLQVRTWRGSMLREIDQEKTSTRELCEAQPV